MIKKITYLIITIFCINLVSAFSANNYNIQIEVYEDGVAKVKNTLIFDSTDLEGMIYFPAFNPTSIIVTDGKKELKFAYLEDSILVKPLENKEDYEIRIQYLTNSLTKKSNGKWIFEYPLKSINEIDEVERMGFLLTLPKMSSVSYFSKNGIISMDNNNLNIVWKVDYNKNLKGTVKTDYKLDTISMKESLRRRELVRNIIIVILGLAVLSIIFYFGYDHYLKRISRGKKNIIHTLNEHEAQVVTLLIKNKNQMYQSKIQKETAISKATLSRIIKRLEQKKIIEIKPAGNTNIIHLTGWFVKK